MNFRASVKYGMLKGLRYKANTFSWFLADIALYSSIIVMYLFLSSAFDSFGVYSKRELGLYISTYFMVNNLFAVFFSEAVSQYGKSVLDGSFSYYQLTPPGALRSHILLNFNFPAMLSTPFLFIMNIYFVAKLFSSPIQILFYYLGVFSACATMLFVFQSITALLLFGIRSSAIGSCITQLFSIAEKPDTVFQPTFRKIFTFVIPAFVFSAVPSRIILGTISAFEAFYLCLSPLIFYALFRMLERIGFKEYQHSGF